MKTNISMKRFLFLLIGLTLSIYVNAQGRNFTFSGEFSQPNADGKIIYYGITDAIKRTVAVKSNVGNDYSGNIIIPSTVTNGGNTYTVTGIAKRAFQGCEVDSLYFPPSITEFEEFNQMFYNGRLDNIHLPENVAYIPDNCFWFTKMKKIWFSKGQRILGPFCLQSVGENPRFYGFAESNIEELRPQALAASSQEVYQDLAVLPKTIRILGHACFGYSPMPLDKVVIPPSMESIGTNVYNIAKDVYISHTMPFTLTSSSFGNQSTLKIHIPVDRSFAFKPVTGWSSYSDKIVEDLQIGPSGYTTFYLENENFLIPTGCTAYIITGVTPSGNIAT
ncbi:MAG: leucine-rich repeat protein, partial [Prevotella salivae]|nr:leucine-rich repeat protein [Segatella salivae]